MMTLEGLPQDFRGLLLLFADAEVDFVIVGAYAMAFHGAPRASGDNGRTVGFIADVARFRRRPPVA